MNPFNIELQTKYSKRSLKELHVACYADNKAPALLIKDAKTGEHLLTASVNAHTYEPKKNCILIKDWSENEGIEQALLRANLIEPTGVVVECGYCVANEHKMINGLLDAWHSYQKESSGDI
jgi:hypothetical protein